MRENYKSTKILIACCIFISLPCLLMSQSFSEHNKIVGFDRNDDDYFGQSVAINGSFAIVGAHYQSEDSIGQNSIDGAGAAYIFEKDGNGDWIHKQKIVASDRWIDDFFGFSVAISGDYAVVGAFSENEDESGVGNFMPSAGSAYIFERQGGGSWMEVQKIVASDRAIGDQFGKSVAIDGNFVLVGALYEQEDENGLNTLNRAGACYIFERNVNGIWTETKKLVSNDRDVDDEFGSSVSISGNYAVVGARLEDEDEFGVNPVDFAGSAYIFERDDNGLWNQVQKIVSEDRTVGNWFGNSVAISGDRVIVGIPYDGTDATGGNFVFSAGAACIFERNINGVWNREQKLVAADRQIGDYFGWSVATSGDYVVVGAYEQDYNNANQNQMFDAGAAYVFRRISADNWIQTEKLDASDRDIEDWFGWSVGISGGNVIVSAKNEDHDSLGGNFVDFAGSAYVFTDPTVDVKEKYEHPRFEVYPIPSNGEFTVELDGNPSLNFRMDVLNNFGQVVATNRLSSNISKVRIGGISAGIYTVRLNTKKTASHRLIVIY